MQMKTLVKLVLEFSEFEDKHPDAGIADFSAYYLAKRKKQPQSVDGDKVPLHNSFAKLVGRMMRLNNFYANLALKEIGIGGLDEFTYLLTIEQLIHPMKTEVISQNFHELSSGLLIIDRLIKKGLIGETKDAKDKRSKLITLTAAGRLKIHEAQKQLVKVSQVFFKQVSEDDIHLCISLLKPVEERFSKLWLSHKGLSFQEIFTSLDGNK
jgi:DNA-binding MarR family transcriptional regulator